MEPPRSSSASQRTSETEQWRKTQTTSTFKGDLVEQENKHSWAWFFRYLKHYLADGEDLTWTLMTDRQKGIISALEHELLNVHVRFCARHILANLKTEIKQGVIPKGFYWQAVRATSHAKHKDAMENIAAVNPHVVAYLEQILHEMWARYAFNQEVKTDHATNNMTEMWNSSLGTIRGRLLSLCLKR